MGEIEQVLEDHDGIDPGGVLAGKLGQGVADFAAHQRLEQIEQLHPVGEAEHGAERLFLDGAAAMGDGLVQNRQAVAGRAVGGPRDQRQGGG